MMSSLYHFYYWYHSKVYTRNTMVYVFIDRIGDVDHYTVNSGEFRGKKRHLGNGGVKYSFRIKSLK